MRQVEEVCIEKGREAASFFLRWFGLKYFLRPDPDAFGYAIDEKIINGVAFTASRRDWLRVDPDDPGLATIDLNLLTQVAYGVEQEVREQLEEMTAGRVASPF